MKKLLYMRGYYQKLDEIKRDVLISMIITYLYDKDVVRRSKIAFSYR